MTGGDCVVLWAPAQDSYPLLPAFAEFIASPGSFWQRLVQKACVELGYDYWP